MIPGALLAALLGLAALAYVLAPLRRGVEDPSGPESSAASEARDLQAQREMLLAALKDLEDDHATGKISDDDYPEQKARLTRRAVDVLKRLDEAQALAREETSRPILRPVPDRPER